MSENTAKCEFCDAVLVDKSSEIALRDWDWFRGYLPRTVHFCPKHKDYQERTELFTKSQIRPPASENKARKFAEMTPEFWSLAIYQGKPIGEDYFKFAEVYAAEQVTALETALRQHSEAITAIHTVATEMWRRGPVDVDFLRERMEQIVSLCSKVISETPLTLLAAPKET